jgi:hypothetical protein
MTLEILNRAFVFLRRCPAVKRAEIFPLPRSRILLAGIQPILAGFQFSNHEILLGTMHAGEYYTCSAIQYSQFGRKSRSLKL